MAVSGLEPKESRMRGVWKARRAAAAAFAIAGLLVLAGCGGDAADTLAEVKRLQDAGSHEQAEELLRDYLGEHPDDLEASFRRGLSLIALGRSSEAVFPLRKALASPELGKQAGLVLAGTLLSTRNYEGAIEAADGVLALEPENETALVTRARAAIGAIKAEAALESIDALAKLNPDALLPRALRAEAVGLVPERLAEAEKLYDGLEAADWGDDEAGPGRACLTHAKLVIERGKDAARAGALTLACAERYGAQANMVIGAATLLDRLERGDEGTQLVRAHFEKDPSNLALRAGLAQRLIAQDEFAEAEKLVLEEAEKQNSPAAWSALSNLRRRLRNNDGALAALDRAIAAGKGSEPEELHADRADLLIDMGRAAEATDALPHIESAVFRNVIEGRLAEVRGDEAEALEKYSAALEQWPDNWGVRARAARVAFELGDVDRALVELREVTRHAPKETDAALQMAQIHLSRGELQEAYAFAWRHINERGATGPEGHLVAARAAAAARRPEEVSKTLEDLIARNDGKFAAVGLAEHARLAAASHGAAAALAALDVAVAKAKLDLSLPENAPALRQAALLATEVDGVDAAIARVDAQLARAPGRADLLGLRGTFLANALRFDEARADAERALAADADAPFGHFALALARRGLGDPKGAVESFDRALALDPTLSDAGYLAAQTLLMNGDTSGGRARLEKLVRVYPDHAGALNDLAWALAESGDDLPRAEKLAEQATRLAGEAEMFDTFGYVRLKQERYDEAARAFRLSLEKNTDYGTARYHLALALGRGGDADGAKKELALALAGSSFPEAEAAKTELARLGGATQ
jgi:Tfp pilus assembly protein PilF